MRRILFLVVFLMTAVLLKAQYVDCNTNYAQKLDEGTTLYHNGDYRAAAKAFGTAHCPLLNASQHAGLDDWAQKCVVGINAQSRSAFEANQDATVKKPSVRLKPEVEILYAGYVKATCEGSVRGAEVMALVFARNLPDSALRVCCVIGPREGGGRVLESSPLAQEYTVNGDRSGQERLVLFDRGEECRIVEFFVPFSVIDFKGNYSPQPLNCDFFVYPREGNVPLAKCHMEFDGLSPHTITVDGHTGDYDLDVDYFGGLFDPLIAVCSGNEPRWSGFPSWIVSDEEGIHITDNETIEPRSAVLHVSSTGGGNVININVFQKGRKEELVPTAVVNRVWHDGVGTKKMAVHVDCEVSGARGRELRVYALFYCEDGTTPLLDIDGDEIKPYAKALAGFTESAFDDIPVFVSHYLLSTATNNGGRHSGVYYICVTENKGFTCLARSGPHNITW
ncbi:MAG: hypothetical protein ACSW8I_02780 [bacterium]